MAFFKNVSEIVNFVYHTGFRHGKELAELSQLNYKNEFILRSKNYIEL